MRLTGRQLLASDVWGLLDRVTNIALEETLTVAGGGGKGAYVELIAATVHRAFVWTISFNNPVGGNIFYVDLAVGAPGSEVVFIEDIVVDTNVETLTYTFIRSLSQGLRVAARCSGGAADTVDISVWYSSQ